ncbi:6d24efdd-47e8-48fc-a4f6-c9a3cf6d6fdb [Staphylotrichum tortipilum]|uniref:6d24efdd-47e8-48fc-a4f6-c9a3cf6d6fdb n=1 Tax=Staphylotrichum tortipilum TaxID=2831512 RepID=A0AAN6MJ50_9PEZI|nr:6d24efdd-47e8-48fc-a4f6-c9a3cf6d6fdb [Staphylotrichum longicolle]
MPPKRKAKDTASPSKPPASRARSARASKPSPATDVNESEALPARPAKRARRTASKAAHQDEDSDDDFEGYGRRASKPATIEQHLMEQSTKSKEFIRDFKDQVAQGREQAEETLARLKQDLINPPTPTANTLPDILATLRTTTPGTGTAPASAKDNPLFKQTQQLLRLSRAILACHQTAERAARPPPDLASPRETWKRDEEGMRELLEWGRIHGERAVERWITPGERWGEMGQEDADQGEGEREREKRSEAENLARGLFEWRRVMEGAGESWGVVARKQMVALAGVVRTLPETGG